MICESGCGYPNMEMLPMAQPSSSYVVVADIHLWIIFIEFMNHNASTKLFTDGTVSNCTTKLHCVVINMHKVLLLCLGFCELLLCRMYCLQITNSLLTANTNNVSQIIWDCRSVPFANLKAGSNGGHFAFEMLITFKNCFNIQVCLFQAHHFHNHY